MKEGGEIIAEIAPAFVGQFGPNITPRHIKAALQELGFAEVYEVALGADIGAIAEAHHYVEKVVTGELPFLLTSCCPAWSMLAKKIFSGSCRSGITGIDTDGCNSKNNQIRASECKSGIYRTMCIEKAGSFQKNCEK